LEKFDCDNLWTCSCKFCSSMLFFAFIKIISSYFSAKSRMSVFISLSSTFFSCYLEGGTFLINASKLLSSTSDLKLYSY
jgi:hypothetical protein